jgi:L,D-transpeptidase ErfK/SrfK
VIGAVSTILALADDTFVDIARTHGLGYHELIRANPGVNPWFPGEGTQIVLPKQFVLPSGPRKGLVLNLPEYRMYYFPEPKAGEAPVVLTYPMSIGRMDWETPIGKATIISKVVNPAWYPPKSVRDEHAAEGRPLPAVVPPGPDNPLGAFAMRLNLPGYLIHSTNRPAGVGMRVTHGCIRMFPEDIEELFPLVALSTDVRIMNTPIKFGWSGDELVMEAHPVLEEPAKPVSDEGVAESEPAAEEVVLAKEPLTYATEEFIVATASRPGRLNWDEVEQLLRLANGIPSPVGRSLPQETAEEPPIKNAATSAAF